LYEAGILIILERVQQKWEPVLRKAIKLARIAYTYPRFAL
jgi:hypothetical protein